MDRNIYLLLIFPVMNVIKLTKDQLNLFQSGSMIETEKGIFYNFPYWIKKNGEDGLYELYAKSEIPGLESTYKRGGLEHSKYIIQKTDGTTVDPEAWYFVLRVDKDPHARVAAIAYALSVRFDNMKLCEELLDAVMAYDPNQLKSSDQWDLMYPYKILDPDGWDRTNYDYSWFEEKITWDEFKNRALSSTVILE